MSIYTSVFGLSVYQDMTRTKQTARLSTNVPPVPSNVRYVENPAYNASVENSESDETQSIECDVSKCQTPPVESNTVGSLHMWKCEPYKNEKYEACDICYDDLFSKVIVEKSSLVDDEQINDKSIFYPNPNEPDILILNEIEKFLKELEIKSNV